MSTIATSKLTNKALTYLRYQVEVMNKKAAKLSLPPMTVTVLSTELVTVRDEVVGIDRTHELHTVEVTGEVPRINGWQVIAKIEFSEVGNFVLAAPGIENLNEGYRTAPNVCHHCNKKRRRNDLVVVRNEEGQEMIVGRNCLADFIRSGDAESMIKAAGWFHDVTLCMSDEEGCDEYSRRKHYEYPETLDTILQYASICIRKLGWKKADDFGGSTKNDVLHLMNPPTGDGRQEWEYWVRKHDLFLTEFDAAEAKKAAEFLAGITGNSEYVHNLRILRDLGTVASSKMGLAVSIIPVAQRNREEAINRPERKVPGPHVGEVGQRLRKQAVTILATRSLESDYGVRTMVSMETPEGSKMVWFASGDQTECYEVGSEHIITFTVKKHETHEKFGKQTLIQRVKDETPELIDG